MTQKRVIVEKEFGEQNLQDFGDIFAATCLYFRFILELGKEMKLSHNTMATGAVYYHRFYMFHSFQDFNRYVVSTCCLFLAGKAEETPKKCRDIGKRDFLKISDIITNSRLEF